MRPDAAGCRRMRPDAIDAEVRSKKSEGRSQKVEVRSQKREEEVCVAHKTIFLFSAYRFNSAIQAGSTLTT